MNAQEKLQFELLSGFYGRLNDEGKLILASNLQSEANYNRLKEVGRGVNTVWLNKPLRTAGQAKRKKLTNNSKKQHYRQKPSYTHTHN